MLISVKVEGFRSCAETQVPLGHTVSALIGRNGVGKTNILQAIRWFSRNVIHGDSVARYQIFTADHAAFEAKLLLDGIPYDYKLYFQREKPADSVKEELNCQAEEAGSQTVFERDNEEIRIANRPDPVRVGRMTPAIRALTALLPGDDPVHGHLSRIRSYFNSVKYYYLEDTPRTSYFNSVKYYNLADTRGAQDIVQEGQYAEWLRRYRDDGELTDSVAFRLIYLWQEERELFDEFRSLIGPEGLGVLNEISEPVILAPNPESGIRAEKLYLLSFKPSSTMGGAGQSLYFGNLSAGTRRVIRMVVSLLFDRRALMLIEEPEDSIHPGLLRKLIDLFRTYSDQTQVLFSTHSPEVLDMLGPEEVLLVTAPDGKTSVRQLSGDELQRARKFLQDEGSLSDYLDAFAE
jgi:predicted ATPase